MRLQVLYSAGGRVPTPGHTVASPLEPRRRDWPPPGPFAGAADPAGHERMLGTHGKDRGQGRDVPVHVRSVPQGQSSRSAFLAVCDYCHLHDSSSKRMSVREEGGNAGAPQTMMNTSPHKWG